MGTREVLLLFMVFFHFHHPVSLLPLANNLSSASFQEKLEDREMNEHKSLPQGDGNGTAPRDTVAFEAASARGAGNGGRAGAGGGRSVGGGEEGNGGASRSPNTAAGTAVIPLYTAGAAGARHNNHHGAASCSRSCVGLPTLGAAILTSLAVHVYVVLGKG